MRTNATEAQINAAIKNVNERLGYRLQIKDFKPISKSRNQFTIRSEKSGIPGSCYAASGRKSIAASWHAHGHLFDELFKISPDIFIISQGKIIDRTGGNWEDYNVGSYYCPQRASDLSIL